jgi:histidinol-phosphate/aromatic aminotransferase/cobyric acid decarboxylase-like protein
MQYREFRALRDRIIAESNPLRMDCMNLSKAVARLTPPPAARSAAVDEASEAWRRCFAPKAAPSQIAVTTGVRPALWVLFAQLAATEYELWLPEDVYPEYWRSAAEANLCARSFVTLPQVNCAPLAEAGRRAAVLLPHPITPLGRHLTPDELAFFRDWLGQNAARRVILDTAYLFDNRLDPATQELLDSDQAFILHSLAKAWLSPGKLGVILSPPAHASAIRIQTDDLSSEELGDAVFALNHCSRLPHDLAETFERQWAALAERIQVASPAWRPPVTGYFSVIPVSFEKLLRQYQILAVPASVFGSRRDDLSVLTCLYYPG